MIAFVTFVLLFSPSRTPNQNPTGPKGVTQVTEAPLCSTFCHLCHAFRPFPKLKIESQGAQTPDKSDSSPAAGRLPAESLKQLKERRVP
jgi:hypothetical protein